MFRILQRVQIGIVPVRWRNTERQYGLIAELLHWLIVALVVVQIVLGVRADELPVGLARLQLLATHKSFGMTVLMLMLLRLGWRLVNPTPRPVAAPGMLRTVARATHWAFYALLIAIPVSGWILSSASNLSVGWFRLFTWPDLVGADQHLAGLAKEVHETLVAALLALVAVHAGAALMHHFVWRDEVLMRMLPRARLFRNERDEERP